jgi:hypothetical protein
MALVILKGIFGLLAFAAGAGIVLWFFYYLIWPNAKDPSLKTAKIIAVFCAFTALVYGTLQVEPSYLMTFFFLFAPIFALVFWLQQDAKANKIGVVTDFGFFVYLTWPILMPWYVFKTRGKAGWRLILGLFALIISADIGWMIGAWGMYGVRYAFAWGIYGIRYARWYFHL